MRHGDAAQHERAPGFQHMDIKTRPHLGLQGAGQDRARAAMVLREGELDVVLAAGHQGNRPARRLHQARVVRGPGRGRACAASSGANANACGVCARNRPERSTVALIRPSAARFSVSATGTAGIAPSCPAASAPSSAATVPGGKKGRQPSWIRTMSGGSSASACSPASTLSWRVAPPGTVAGAPVPPARHRSTPVAHRLHHAHFTQQRRRGVMQDGPAGQRRELLRRGRAEARAVPPATRMAARRGRQGRDCASGNLAARRVARQSASGYRAQIMSNAGEH